MLSTFILRPLSGSIWRRPFDSVRPRTFGDVKSNSPHVILNSVRLRRGGRNEEIERQYFEGKQVPSEFGSTCLDWINMFLDLEENKRFIKIST